MFIGFGKKFLTVLTASALVIASIPALAANSADDTSTGNKYEFEDGVLDGCKAESWTKIDECASGNSADISDFSGTGFAYIEQKGTSVTVTVNVERDDLYELSIRFCQPFDLSKKVQYLNVNDVNQGEVSFPYCEKFEEISAGYIPLKAGENTIQLKSYWGYTLFDYLVVKDADSSIKDLSPVNSLSNKNASDSTKRLYSYLRDMYGEHVISGQQEYVGSHNYNYNADPSTGYIVDNEEEFDYLVDKTGKMPAIRGIDFLNYNSSPNMWDDYAAERAVEWSTKYNGITALCWHWSVPSEKDGTSRYFYVKSANSSNYTTFSISKALEEGTWEHDVLMADIKVIAGKLQLLEDADVPVLWRPLHEAEGGWFWWGAEGPEKCKELYHLLYDQLTNVYGLDNLIWVWTGYTYPTSPDWYPGDEYVDIVGYDKYNAVDGLPNLSSISSTFYNLVASTNGKKIVTMSENDSIPSLENLVNDKAAWLWFCPWYKNYLMSEQNNPVDNLKELYNSDYCITLDELPDLKSYPLNGVNEGTETDTTTEETTTISSDTPTSTDISSITETSSEGSSDTPSESSSSDDTDTSVSTDNTTADTASQTEETEITSIEDTSTEDTSTSYDISDAMYGDVNLDGIINISDVILLNRNLVGSTSLDYLQKENANCVYDSSIDVNDSFMIMRFISKIIPQSNLGPQ